MSYRTQSRTPQGRGAQMSNQQSRGAPPLPQQQQQTKIIYHQSKQQMPQMMQSSMQSSQQGTRGQQNMGQQQHQQHYQVQQQQQQQQQQHQQLQQQQLQQQQMKQDALVDQTVDAAGDTAMDGINEHKLRWLKKKSGLTKVSKKIRRKRLNLRMRKVIQPKSPFMVLNELKPGGVKYRSADQGIAFLNGGMHTVICEIDGRDIKGQGVSKSLAKQAAAENAIKAVIAERVKQEKLARIAKENAGEAMETETKEEGGEDVPWCTLASFAMYKLLSEWTEERDPTITEIIPHLMSVTSLTANAAQGNGTAGKLEGGVKPPLPMKKPIENPTERHPVMLLNHLRPGLTYVERGQEMAPSGGGQQFTIGVTVDNQNFTGKGRNKKEAKKECAKAVLEKLYNIYYPPDTTPPPPPPPPPPAQGR